MTQPKPTHGGARKGASRKPVTCNRVKLTVSIPPPQIKWRCIGCGEYSSAAPRKNQSRESCLKGIARRHIKAGCVAHTPQTHGGIRPGAGRPASGKAGVNLTVRLPVATKARIKALAAKAGVSASEIVRRRFVEK